MLLIPWASQDPKIKNEEYFFLITTVTVKRKYLGISFRLISISKLLNIQLKKKRMYSNKWVGWEVYS